jgi:hypothetical protein
MTLLLDTGALQSILPWGFARAHNLVTKSDAFNRSTVDSNGRLVKMPVLENVPVQFDGESRPGTLDFLMSASEATDGGILAPQDIVRPGWVVIIDLRREELRYEQQEVALKRLGGDASAPVQEIDFHRCHGEGLFERSHRIVTANINGISSSMLIDTGASRTVITRNNPALPSMLGVEGYRTTSRGISSTGSSLIVDNVRLEFSQLSFVLPILVNPTSDMCSDGALGADVLRHCTLVWGWSSLWAACHPPAGQL